MTPIDLKTWKRKEHFEFFSGMASPFFGITAEVDCTTAHEKAKRSGESFFAHYLHKSMLAVNSVEELKYRITGEEVVVCDTVHAGATIGRPDGTFGLIFVHFSRILRRSNGNWKAKLWPSKIQTACDLITKMPRLIWSGTPRYPGLPLRRCCIRAGWTKANLSRKSHLESLRCAVTASSCLYRWKPITGWQTAFI